MSTRQLMIVVVSLAVATDAVRAQSAQEKIHPLLMRQFGDAKADAAIKGWVLFADKNVAAQGGKAKALRSLEASYNRRAVQRRQLRRTAPGLCDERDLPVAEAYLQAVAATGAKLRHTSKWVNGVSVVATRQQFRAIAALGFVSKVQIVRHGQRIEPVAVSEEAKAEQAGKAAAGTLDYGESLEQLTQISLVALHNLGYTGQGVIIGILDTGFQRTHAAFNNPLHPLSVIAEYDFVNDDPNTAFETGDPPSQHAHGTYILGTIGAYQPGELVGGAYDASFVLCKTEDTTGEYQAEEDNWVAGLEFIEAHGGDLATSSLRYSDWYTQADMDGLTGVTTIAANTATANGLHITNAVGNSGHDSDPGTSTLGAPADAFGVISCGAVDNTGVIASFSTDGPTADGRIKPEVLARGVNTRTVSATDDTTYAGVGGTSLSTPLVACAVACLTQLHPTWSSAKMRQQLMETASDFVANGQPDPLFVRGYGIVNAYDAAQDVDCNGNGIDDAIDIAQGTSVDLNTNGIPDECEPDIPAVSTWGLVATALMILAAGTGILTRRRVLTF